MKTLPALQKGLLLVLASIFTSVAFAQNAPMQLLEDKDNVMLTIFLKHAPGKNIREIRKERETNDFANFPPPGIELVQDYRMLGVGRVMVLRVPPERMRQLTVAMEEKVWGPYETEIYVTYDLIKAREADKRAAAKAKQ